MEIFNVEMKLNTLLHFQNDAKKFFKNILTKQ